MARVIGKFVPRDPCHKNFVTVRHLEKNLRYGATCVNSKPERYKTSFEHDSQELFYSAKRDNKIRVIIESVQSDTCQYGTSRKRCSA